MAQLRKFYGPLGTRPGGDKDNNIIWCHIQDMVKQKLLPERE